jgi:uncharacterized membrane protein
MAMFLVVAAGLLLAAAVMARTGRLSRNYLVGIRLPSTMKSDAAWHAAHRASAWSIAVAGVVLLATAGLSVSRDWSTEGERALVLGMTTLAVIVVFVGAVQAHLVAKKHQRY